MLQQKISFFYFLSYVVHPQSSMLQGIERYMKQAIVDKVPSVSSAALCSSLVSHTPYLSCISSRKWIGALDHHPIRNKLY